MTKENLINLLLSIFFLLPVCTAEGQVKDAIHLSYNLTECCETRKMINPSQKLQFYIGEEHFETISDEDPARLDKEELDSVPILEISEFLEIAEKERKRLIKNGEKNGTLKVLFNDEVFDRLYLYEKNKSGHIKKYLVRWIEEIE